MGKVPTSESHRQLLKRGVAEIIVEEELVKLLESGRKLRLKQGFDPSCPDIHLGHVVGLRKLRQFQELGHQVILIVGDWTARIGDPSGESQTRPMLSAEEVRTNAETYMKQFFEVVDRERTRVVWQSEWFGKFSLADVIGLTSKFTVAQMLQREDFSKRYASGRPIAITEFLYPLLQAYDSIVIEADVEFGGTDQTFNCLVGRELQQMTGQPPQQVFLVPLLIGTDGSMKMSKSLGNYIAIDEPPGEIYGKVMSIPDDLMMDYFELLTDVPDEELEEFRKGMESGSVNPMVLKKRLARDLVEQFHDKKGAQESENNFEKTVQKREVPEEITEYQVSFASLVDALGPAVRFSEFVRGDAELDIDKHVKSVLLPSVPFAGLLTLSRVTDTRAEAKRLLAQGAVEVDGKKSTIHSAVEIRDGSIIKVGKRRFVKIVDADKQT